MKISQSLIIGIYFWFPHANLIELNRVEICFAFTSKYSCYFSFNLFTERIGVESAEQVIICFSNNFLADQIWSTNNLEVCKRFLKMKWNLNENLPELIVWRFYSNLSEEILTELIRVESLFDKFIFFWSSQWKSHWA